MLKSRSWEAVRLGLVVRTGDGKCNTQFTATALAGLRECHKSEAIKKEDMDCVTPSPPKNKIVKDAVF